MPLPLDPILAKQPKLLSSDQVIHLQSPRDTNELQKGDIVVSWDLGWIWDDDCLSADQLEEWRFVSDPLADAYIATLEPSEMGPSHDQLQLLLQHAQSRPEAKALLEHLSSHPPEGIRATDQEQRDAREMFGRFAGGLLLGTFYISLVGGFSSPRITNVLHKTSYLVAPLQRKDLQGHTGEEKVMEGDDVDPDELQEMAYAPINDTIKKRTSIRLQETLQFVLDLLGCPTTDPDQERSEDEPMIAMEPLHGEGWKSVVRTRLLHAIVRRRLLGQKGKYDFQKDGYPINVEDMTATLASFCVAPLWACYKIGSPIPDHLKMAYVAHWRHVGWYLGIPLEQLRHFTTFPRANKLFASLLTHLFAHPSDFDFQSFNPPSLPLLHSMADQPPFRTKLEAHFRMARFMLGDQLATALKIPYSSPWQIARLRWYITALVIPEYFGTFYRSGWERARADVTRELLTRLNRFFLGRHSTFRPHTVTKGAKAHGQLPEDVEKEEKITLNPTAGRRALRRYRRLMVEMFCVSGIAIIATGVTAWFGASRILFAIGMLRNDL